MTNRPQVLNPATPAQLLSYVVSHCRHPTTIVVGLPKDDFIAAVVQAVQPHPPQEAATPNRDDAGEQPPQEHLNTKSIEQHAEEPLDESEESFRDPLLRQTLLQIAVSRHIRIVFTPSVTHLRAWLSVFSPSTSTIQPPPVPQASRTPALICYGFVELHRDTSEWSAQGLGDSAATLVDAAARHGFRAIIVEPPESIQGADEGTPDIVQVLDEKLPLLKGMAVRDDGTWSGRVVNARRVLKRWFEFEDELEQ